jgi:hypothetical protein
MGTAAILEKERDRQRQGGDRHQRAGAHKWKTSLEREKEEKDRITAA